MNYSNSIFNCILVCPVNGLVATGLCLDSCFYTEVNIITHYPKLDKLKKNKL